MAVNQQVVVTAQWTDGVNFGSGNYQIVASGILMESSAVAIVSPIIMGQLDQLGSFSPLTVETPSSLASSNAPPNSGIPILASDQFGQTNGQYNLTWNFKIVINAITDIVVSDVPIIFSLGATQGLFSILQAAGWSPTPT